MVTLLDPSTLIRTWKWIFLQNNSCLVPLVRVIASLILNCNRYSYLKIFQVFCLLPPLLFIGFPLLGQRSLPAILGDGPVLGRLVLVMESREKVSHLSSEHHLCRRPPGVLYGGVPALYHGPHELVVVEVAPWPHIVPQQHLP